MKVHISKGNTKVGHIANVSMTPIKSCGNCSQCKKDCYAKKAYRMYPATRRAWDENYETAVNYPAFYFKEIDQWVGRAHPRPALFRWHVSGDILDQGYLEHMKAIARNNPDTKFLAFTKMYNLNYSDLPENLAIVLSGWPGLEMKNPYNLPVAWLQDGTEERIPEGSLECFGRCESCGMCWNLKRLHKDVFFMKH